MMMKMTAETKPDMTGEMNHDPTENTENKYLTLYLFTFVYK